MTDHRDTRDPGRWRRDIVAATVVVLSLGGAGLWTLLWLGLVLLGYHDSRSYGIVVTWRDLIEWFSLLLPVWVMASIPVILVLWWEKRARRGRGDAGGSEGGGEGGLSMTAVGYTANRTAKWMRHLGRALVLISAVLWTIHALPGTLMALGMFLWGWLDSAPTFREVMANVDMRWWRFASSLVLQLGLYLFTPWISAVIAWRWQAIGGSLLVLEGLFVLLKWFAPVIPLMLRDRRLGMDLYQSFMILVMLIAGLLALAAGSLFLASWWKSRTSEIAPSSGQRRLR